MDTKAALEQLGVGGLSEEQRHELDENGYFYIEDAFPEKECEWMASEIERIVEAECGGAGEVSVESGATRISNIFNKSKAFDSLLEIKPLLAAAHYLLGEIAVHGAEPGPPGKARAGGALSHNAPLSRGRRGCDSRGSPSSRGGPWR